MATISCRWRASATPWSRSASPASHSPIRSTSACSCARTTPPSQSAPYSAKSASRHCRSRFGGMTRVQKRGIEVAAVRRLLLERPGVLEGRSYGLPSFLLNGRFLARFRDDDTVLVLQLATIGERDVLMDLDERSFFFTDHYRNYPAVLVRLAEVPPALLSDVLRESWSHVATLPAARPRKARKARKAKR